MSLEEAPPYVPSEWGKEFHGLQVDEALGAGSAGPGKSLVMLADPLFLVAIEDERCRKKEIRWGESTCKILSLRRQLNELGETEGRARKMFPRLDPNVKFKDEDGKTTATFRSGMKFIFGGCKDKGDYVQYQGAEYTRIYYDELAEFERNQYEEINTRNRSSDATLAPFVCIRAATNPDPGWVRTMFVDPAPKGRVVLRQKLTRPNGDAAYVTRMFLPATLYDNPNKEFVKQYELKLLARPAHIRNSLLFGDWYTISGGFYADDWRRDLHVVRPFLIPKHWPVFRVLDWGFKKWGTCLWVASDEDGNLYVFREFNFRFMEARKVAKRIRQIEEDLGLWDKKHNKSKITGPADHNLWEERGSAAESKAEEMIREGISWVPATKSNKSKNAQRFISRLKDHGDGTITPGIVFFDDCRECIRTIPGIKADENDPETPAKAEDDHWHDAVLYACAHRAQPANDQSRDWYDDDEEDEEEVQQRRAGSRGYGGF